MNREDLSPRGFFLVANVRHLATKKKGGLANPTNGFLRVFFLIRHISRKKKLEIARFRFRQCVSLGRQN